MRDNQNDEINKKVAKVKSKGVDKDFLNSITRTKAKPDAASDEFIAKVNSYLFHSFPQTFPEDR